MFCKQFKNGHSKQRQITPMRISAVLTALLLITLSCQAPALKTTDKATEQPPTAPSSPPVTTSQPPTAPAQLTASWKADGAISPGEYKKSKVYNDYEMHWATDGQCIYLAIKAKTTGWVAIGFGAETLMKNSDIIEGFVTNGKVTVQDMFSTGEFGPHPPDEQMGGTNDILEAGGLEENGYTVIEFKRRLDTGDKFDKVITQGINKIIWAYGTDDQAMFKHSTRGFGEIDL